MKKYKKVQVVAKNNPQGSYAAGCPTGSSTGSSTDCRKCDRTK